MFLKIDGVEGESRDDFHKGWIDVLAYRHAVRTEPGAPGPGSRPRVTHDELTVFKSADRTSAALLPLATGGQRVPQVLLDVCRDDRGRQLCFLGIELRLARVTSLSFPGPVGDGPPFGKPPLEKLTLSYRVIQWTYEPVDASGRPVGRQEFSWDLDEGKGGGGESSNGAIGYGQGSGAAFLTSPDTGGEATFGRLWKPIGLSGFTFGGDGIGLTKGTDVATGPLLRLLHRGEPGRTATVVFACHVDHSGQEVCDRSLEMRDWTVLSLSYDESQQERLRLAPGSVTLE
jgi:type VI secretion system Hcp family effector